MKKLQDWIDKAAVTISAVLLAMMMIILVVNIVLRYTPGIGGVKWYMESTQYLNVWSMFVVGISISVKNEHLNVNLLESMVKGVGKKIIKCLVAFFTVLFYIGLAYGTYLLATRANQEISTMPIFKMSLVYWLIPITSVLCSASAVIGLIVDLTENKQLEGGAQS